MFQDRKISSTDSDEMNEMTETELYKKDLIGLKVLNEAKKVKTY